VVLIWVPLWGSGMSVIDFRISLEQGIPFYECLSPYRGILYHELRTLWYSGSLLDILFRVVRGFVRLVTGLEWLHV
jgi:hypothetical protein